MSNYVERTRTGYGSRLKGAFGGIIFGFVLLAVSVFLLFWNEGRAVKRYKDLKEGRGSVVSVSSESVDSANEGKLIHTSGKAVTGGALTDADFGISVQAIKLSRDAEIYQWVENVTTKTEKKVGGSEETEKTYSYSKEWRSQPVDSSSFKISGEHANKGTLKYPSNTLVSDSVTLGAFTVPKFLVTRISNSEPFPLENLNKASAEVKSTGQITNQGVYFGNDPNNPQVGDVRVTFKWVKPGDLSIIAQQQGKSFAPFQTKTGGSLGELTTGIKSADEMFTAAEKSNKVMTWILRAAGFFFLTVGFGLILKPLSVAADLLPAIGNLVGAGAGVISFLLAAVVWTIVVALAWLWYRPLLGIAILVVTAVLIFLVIRLFVKNKKAAESRVATVGPPASTPPPASGGPPPLD